MARGKDREYLRRAISDGWPINPDDMARFYGLLKWAAQKAHDDKNPREVNACVRTMVAIVGQRQSDEQLDEKNRRLDSGQITERIAVDHALEAVMDDPEALAVADRIQARLRLPGADRNGTLNGSAGGPS